MCSRTVSALARALEAGGIATVALISIRQQAETIGPPRGLHCAFPLGRPLGRPDDHALQRRVLDAAFGLLERSGDPVIVDFDEEIRDEVETPLACPLPPRSDANEHPAIDEVRGLRPAYDRTYERLGSTQVGRVVDADGLPEAMGALVRVADGAGWGDVEVVGGDFPTLLQDLRAYYEEAALGLSDHVPAARKAESWFFQKTRAGALVHAFFDRVKDSEPAFPGLYYVIPASQVSDRLF
ncbi:MAG: hypothetical protein CL908_05535 [Deltaproteobacteria bacterium]|jgi:D-proline reductase (dithiol) PrdB|nr:hypothetical protein [Deltaproteobacteria bacterium]